MPNHYAVDIYEIGKPPRSKPFSALGPAKHYAYNTFSKNRRVYKVKVWDITRTGRIPNRPGAPNLKLELV